MRDPNSLDLPFEESPAGQTLDLKDANLSGGVVTMAVSVPVPDGEGGKKHHPGIVFRFATPTGDFYPPMLLVLDEDQAGKLPNLLSQTVRAAIRAARRQNRS